MFLSPQPRISQPQALQWQILVDILDLRYDRSQQRRQAPVGDNLDPGLLVYSWDLFVQSLYQTLYESDMPENDARLHVLNRVFAQGMAWRC